MPTISVDAQVSDAQLSRYARLIYEMTGIRISPQKKALLSNRLRRRLKATGVASYEAYLNHLRKLSSDDPEWDAFLQEITTHDRRRWRTRYLRWQLACGRKLGTKRRPIARTVGVRPGAR